MGDLSSTLAEFGRSLWGKVIGVLTIVTMVVGIYVEVLGAWHATNESIITSYNVEKSKIESCGTRAVELSKFLTGYELDAGVKSPAYQKFISDCAEFITPEQRGKDARRAAELQAKSDSEALIQQAEAAFQAGHYEEAFNLGEKFAPTIETREIKTSGKAGDETADMFFNLSWYGLFAHRFSEALAAANRVLTIRPHDLTPMTNRAHALLLLGRSDEAKAIYLAHKDDQINDKPWAQAIIEDLASLRKAGITDPMMADVEAALKAMPVTPPKPFKPWHPPGLE